MNTHTHARLMAAWLAADGDLRDFIARCNLASEDIDAFARDPRTLRHLHSFEVLHAHRTRVLGMRQQAAAASTLLQSIDEATDSVETRRSASALSTLALDMLRSASFRPLPSPEAEPPTPTPSPSPSPNPTPNPSSNSPITLTPKPSNPRPGPSSLPITPPPRRITPESKASAMHAAAGAPHSAYSPVRERAFPPPPPPLPSPPAPPARPRDPKVPP